MSEWMDDVKKVKYEVPDTWFDAPVDIIETSTVDSECSGYTGPNSSDSIMEHRVIMKELPVILNRPFMRIDHTYDQIHDAAFRAEFYKKNNVEFGYGDHNILADAVSIQSGSTHVQYTQQEIMDEWLDEVFTHEFEDLNAYYLLDARWHLAKDDGTFRKRLLDEERIDWRIKQLLNLKDMKPLTRWRGFLKEVKSFMPGTILGVTSGVVIAGLALALAGVIAGVYKLCRSMTYCFQNLVYDNKATKETIEHIPRGHLIPEVKAMLNQQDKDQIAAIRKNIVTVSWKNNTIIESMYALFLNSNTLLLNKHFFHRETEHRNAGAKIYLSQPCGGQGELPDEVVCIPPDQRIDCVEDRDVYVCKLSVNWPNIRNINKLLDEQNKVDKYAILLGKTPEEDISVSWTGSVVIDKIHNDKREVCWINYHSGVTTQSGDCGRPYFIPGHGIIAIHTAICDNKAYGAATRVPKINVNDTPYKKVVITSEVGKSNFWESPAPLNTQTKFDGIAITQPIIRKTALDRIVSPLFVIDEECDYQPSAKQIMRVDGVLVDPYIMNSNKWTTLKRANVPLRYIYAMTRHYVNKMDIDYADVRVLTDDEMINGIAGLGTINMRTSPGIWNLFFKKGKTEIFAALPQEELDGELLPLKYEFSERAKTERLGDYQSTFVEILKEKELDLLQGAIPSFPFICTFKDELRSKEKCEAGKTRIFEQSSLDFVLLCRKYFGHFVANYRQKAGFTLHHGIGSDPDSKWGLYAKGLYANSPYGHAFDYKNFDGSVPKECYTFFRMVTDEYYKNGSDDEKRARHALIDNMQNAYHIMGKYMFESSQGNKSGNAFTDVFNSISNIFLMYESFVAWQIGVAQKPMNLCEFDDNVKMLTYGDDVVMSIKMPLLAAGFDGPFIQSVMTEMGVTITSALKSAKIEEYVEFKDLTFLKRPFVFDKEYGTWKAPLPLKDILKELKYRPTTASNNSGDIEQRLRNVQRFLVHWDRDTFEEIVSRLRGRDVEGEYRGAFNVSYDALNLEIVLKQKMCEPLF
jgi:hypothetical protein